MRPDRSLEDGEGAGSEFVFFELGDFILTKRENMLVVDRHRMSGRRKAERFGRGLLEFAARLVQEVSACTLAS